MSRHHPAITPEPIEVYKPNLWFRFWYATLLIGGIGLVLTFIGLASFSDITLGIGLFLVCLQAGFLLNWYFSTEGNESNWMIITIGGQMICYCTPKRFMCPRLGNLLAEIDTTIPLKVQAVFGKRGKGLDKEGEVGAPLGKIRYFRMTSAAIAAAAAIPAFVGLRFPEDDPLNLDTTEAEPEVTVLLNIENPCLVKRLEVRNKDTGKLEKSGMNVAVNQMAEDVRAEFQDAVTGYSISAVPFMIKKIRDEIKNGVTRELHTRGLYIEPQTVFSITDYGETEQMIANVAKINNERVGGMAIVEKEKQAAAAADHIKKRTITEAEGKSKAEIEAAKARSKDLELRFNRWKAAGLTKVEMGRILEQEAIETGIPILPEKLGELIITIGGGDAPSLLRGGK